MKSGDVGILNLTIGFCGWAAQTNQTLNHSYSSFFLLSVYAMLCTGLLPWQLTDNSSTSVSRCNTKKHTDISHKEQNIQSVKESCFFMFILRVLLSNRPNTAVVD